MDATFNEAVKLTDTELWRCPKLKIKLGAINKMKCEKHNMITEAITNCLYCELENHSHTSVNAEPASQSPRANSYSENAGKFRKKPVVVEAIQYLGDINFNFIRLFVGNDYPLHRIGNQKLFMDTLEGGHEASPNDWIIKGVKGEFYPCKPDVFEQTYEIAE